MRIPLLVSPSLGIEADRLVRLQDLGGLILRAAGIEPQETDNLLEEDELFLTELFYQTYRRGRFKSTRARKTGVTTLFDLVEDPGETRDVAAEHPRVVMAHEKRIEEVAAKLATYEPMPEALTVADLEALRALGYAK